MHNDRGGFAYYFTVAVLTVLGAVGLSWLASSQEDSGDRGSTDSTKKPLHLGDWTWIKRDSRDSVLVYVAYPERRTPAPAVIVIHEAFGLTDWEQAVADRFAAKGYIAIVPDLLSPRFGKTPPSEDSARKLSGVLVPEAITKDLDAVYQYANALPSIEKENVGVIGFGWGGGQAFRYASNNPKLKATAVGYGPPPSKTVGQEAEVDSAALHRITSPILGIYGQQDSLVNSTLPRVGSLMRLLGKEFSADSFPGTASGFLKPGRAGYDTQQRAIAWQRIDRFFERLLLARR